MLRVAVGHAALADACDGIEQAVAMLGETGAAAREAAMPGILYLSQALAGQAGVALAHARELLPLVDWYGAVAPGVFGLADPPEPDKPALSVALVPVPVGQWHAIPAPVRGRRLAHSALLHAPADLDDIVERIDSCAACFENMVGGLIVADAENDHAAQFVSNIVLDAACGGIAFDGEIQIRSRLTQGCRPLAGEHVVSDCTAHYIETLDGLPALDVLLADLGVPQEIRHSTDGEEILRALPAHRLRRGLLIGLAEQSARGRAGFGDYAVRELIGIDPLHRILAVAAAPRSGQYALFCTRDERVARADLIRVCTELRDEVESEGLAVIGAHYTSCASRPALFGSTAAELEVLRHNLGDTPIFGFFANGEIFANRIHGHSAVLTLFVR